MVFLQRTLLVSHCSGRCVGEGERARLNAWGSECPDSAQGQSGWMAIAKRKSRHACTHDVHWRRAQPFFCFVLGILPHCIKRGHLYTTAGPDNACSRIVILLEALPWTASLAPERSVLQEGLGTHRFSWQLRWDSLLNCSQCYLPAEFRNGASHANIHAEHVSRSTLIPGGRHHLGVE